METTVNASLLTALEAQKAAFQRRDFELARLLSDSVFNYVLADGCRVDNKTNCDFDVSIVIVSHRCCDHTLNLLKAAENWKLPFTYEVVVVINDDRDLRLVAGSIFPSAVVVDSPVNLGASGGRNLGAHWSTGRYLIFIDDDGWTDEASLIALYDTCIRYNATGVRGRVQPRDNTIVQVPAHYTPGDRLSPSYMDIEGITIWNAKHFKEAGGFDRLLFGHEGFELFARLLRWHGPHAFLYTPEAVLLHDFESSTKPATDKRLRYEMNQAYLAHLGIKFKELLRTINHYRTGTHERAIFVSSLSYTNYYPQASDPFISIVTTAKDAEAFCADYTDSLRRQGHQNYEVVFVDDHSEDNTANAIREAWKGDDRLRFFTNDGEGRAAALNTAMKHAKGEICIIADADDLMVPSRLQWTARYFEDNPESSCLSFYIFNEENAFRGTRPLVSSPTSIRLRSFVGMPVSFPGFAFKKTKFTLSFDESLQAGIDCDWLFRHIKQFSDIDGQLLPIASSYYRLHDGQISSQHRSMQRDVGYSHVRDLHRQLIHFDEVKDEDTLLKLMGWRPLESGNDVEKIFNYVLRFKEGGNEGHDVGAIREYLLKAARELQIERLRHDYSNVKNMLATERAKKARMGAPATQKSLAKDVFAGSGSKGRSYSIDDIERFIRAEDEWLASFKIQEKAKRSLFRFFRRKKEALPVPFHFDEQAYLDMNSDVRESVEAGNLESGFHHFVQYGRQEGRSRPLAGG